MSKLIKNYQKKNLKKANRFHIQIKNSIKSLKCHNPDFGGNTVIMRVYSEYLIFDQKTAISLIEKGQKLT